MAGYNGYSMSNNAVAAYEGGLVPASKIKGVPATLVKIWCNAEEWHHTSKHYNWTDFYDPAEVRLFFGLDPQDGTDPSDHDDNAKTWADLGNKGAMAALENHKIESKEGKTIVHKDCYVAWLEWSGSRTRPICNEVSIDGVVVKVRGKTATIIFSDGEKLIKRLGTRGFSFIPEYTQHCKEKKKQDKILAREQAKRGREFDRKCIARGLKLPKYLQQTVDFTGKAWAAISKDAKRALDVRQMDFDNAKNSESEATGWFGSYREACRSTLSQKGVVMSGVVITIRNSLYFLPKWEFEDFDSAFQDALANQ